ncbi:MAG: YbbR-like domain-containing protein [Bacteroidia bacterium]|nr:MAG: YbbR-like domain-containing protein [Bacteroidia bacterium]
MNWNILWRKKDVLTPGEAASKRKVYIFLLCLVCSAVFWLFSKLTQESQAVFHRPVAFYNIPEDQSVVMQSDTIVSFTLQSKGLRLIREQLFLPKDSLLLDAESVPQINRDGTIYRFLSDAMLIQAFENITEGRVRILKARPDTLLMELAPSVTRTLPVILNADISFERRFGLYGNITLDPDSITLKGPKTVMDEIKYVETELWKAHNLRRTTQENLELILPARTAPREAEKPRITVSIPVEEFTEATKDLRVHMICPEQYAHMNVRIFPSRVTVHYLVALRDYQAVSEEMFRAVAYCPQAMENSDGRLEVLLENYPSFVEILYHRPRHVEYIILE